MQRRLNRAAMIVSHDHNKLRAQVLARVFDASQLMGVNHVSRNADDEQIANARRENGIGHNARIRASHHNGVWRLAVRG